MSGRTACGARTPAPLPVLPCAQAQQPRYPRYHRYQGRWIRQSFDAEYVRLLTDGDPEVERHFTAYFGDLLRLKLRSRLRSKEWVQDAHQETLLRVLTTLRCRGGLEHPERLGAFVNAVCNNVLLEAYRDGARHRPVSDDVPEQLDQASDPETALVTKDGRGRVRAILASLPARDQEVLRIVFFEDVDRAEACRRLQVEDGYLRVLLHRAKTRFKARLADRFPEGFRAVGMP